MRPSRLIRCEEDIIIIGHSFREIFIGLFFFGLGAFLIDFGAHSNDLFNFLMSILFGGISFLGGLYWLLINDSVTINKKFQSIVVDKKFILKRLKSIRIPFSDIKGIVIIRRKELSEMKGFFISIIPNNGKYSRIYSIDPVLIASYDESDVERVAEKISKMTNKEILRSNLYLISSEPDSDFGK